jgi:hypothetical protein
VGVGISFFSPEDDPEEGKKTAGMVCTLKGGQELDIGVFRCQKCVACVCFLLAGSGLKKSETKITVPSSAARILLFSFLTEAISVPFCGFFFVF